jgi:hypothetical protein
MKNKMPKNTSPDRWSCLEYDAFLLLGVSKTILETLRLIFLEDIKNNNKW